MTVPADLPPASLARVVTYLRDTLPSSKLTLGEQNIAWVVGSHYNAREGCARPSQTALAKETGRPPDVIYRALRAVTRAGIWTVERSNTRATRYRFPLAGVVHTPRVPRGEDVVHTPRVTRGDLPAWDAGTSPRPTRGELLQGTEQRNMRAAHAPAWCTPTCATCGGIGWVQHGDETMRMSAPCPERMAWAR